ncbi:MAG TPA: FG-GAP-like repeat-containing protein [Candidatus Syntrophosphaera sp.]|nr:FG-GAP-like repeat-containing protein [Candidatus Syntrophosphaera sp.]
MSNMRSATLMITLLLSINLLNALNDMPIVASFQGEHHRSAFGHSMVSLDFNHDGLDDLAITSPNYGYVYPGTTDPGTGKCLIYYGVSGFNSNTPASITLEGTNNGTSGTVVLFVYKIGDINGDSYDDLCLHIRNNIAWPDDDREQLLFFYGGTTNLDNPDYVLNLYGSVYTFFRILPLGDVNRDGFGDMGFYYLHSPSYLNRLSIIWGGSFQEHVVSNGEASYSYSCSIHGIGDINNDGYDDFTTGFATPSSDPTHNLIRLYYGNAAGITDNPITLIYCQYGVSRGSKPLGDMNADGYDDFMGYITDEGMHAWLGGTNINYAVPDFDMDPPWYGGEFQRSLEHGDFNNDGFEDAVGASFGSGFAVWLGKQNVNGTSDYIQYNPGYENYGYSLVTGDFNADGYDDIAIAASHEYDPWPSGNFTGYVWVFGGNAQLEDTTVASDDQVAPIPEASIMCYPQPASSKVIVSVKSEQAGDLGYSIYNIRGQIVFSGKLNGNNKEQIFELPNEAWERMPSGVYLISLERGNSTIATARLVVAK